MILLASLIVAVHGAAQESYSELLSQAAALASQGDFQASIAKLQAARAINPSDYKVNLLLGTELLRIGRTAAALPALRIAADAPSDDGTAAARLGAANFLIGDFGLASEAFQQAISRAPHSEEFLSQWGDFSLERFRTLQTQLQASQSGMAAVLRFQVERSLGSSRIGLLERSALADSRQPGIWGELGVANLHSGNLNKAEENLRLAKSQQAEDLWTLRLQALLASQHGNWREAESRLQDIADRSPAVFLQAAGEWPARLMPPQAIAGAVWNCLRRPALPCAATLRRAHRETGSDAATLFSQQRWEDLSAAAFSAGNESMMRYWRGAAFAELQDIPRAIPLLESGLDAGQEHAAFLLLRCYASAAKNASDRLASSKFEASAHRLRGDFFVRVNDDAKSAIAEYQQAISLQPREAALHERLAQAYWSEKRILEARNAAKTALALQSSRPLTLRLLISMAMEERDYPAAEALLTKFLELKPRDSWANVQLGIALAQIGRLDRADMLLQQEIARGYPDDRGAIHAILARILRKLGRSTEAAETEAESVRLADKFQQGAPKASDEVQ